MSVKLVESMQRNKNEKFQVLTAVNVKVTVFWDVMCHGPDEPAISIFLNPEDGVFAL
jgi:hypothetical protein